MDAVHRAIISHSQPVLTAKEAFKPNSVRHNASYRIDRFEGNIMGEKNCGPLRVIASQRAAQLQRC